MAENQSGRLEELRRRIQEDPASIAFAQLAEECRRTGHTEEAVSVAQAGLAVHKDYTSARVTLGRALLELGRLDEARAELITVLTSAPDNLAAIRAIAELHRQRGEMPDALGYYRRALALARHDAELETTVRRIEHEVDANAASSPTPLPPPRVEDLFDFDHLLQQLGLPEAEAPMPPLDLPDIPRIQRGAIAPAEATADDSDPFFRLERQLRDAPDPAEQRRVAVLTDLEDWLAAIVADRSH